MTVSPRRAPSVFPADDPPIVGLGSTWPGGATTEWHSHDRAQLLFAIEGVMEVRLEAGTWIVPPNRALWIAAGDRHEVRMSGRVKMRSLYVGRSAASTLPGKTSVINVSPLLRELIVAAVGAPQDYGQDSRDGRLMRLLLDELRTSDVMPLHLPMPNEPRVRSIADALIDDPARSATAADWASKAGVATKTVHRLFLKETGMSFAQWRQQARLLYALRRMADGGRIIDVAFDCGYASQSAFTVMFKRHFGMPPSVFYR